jgi:hypothetical protein
MKRKTLFPNRLFSGALHVAAFAILVIDNFNKLWLCILFFGVFLFITMIQSDFGTTEQGPMRFYWVSILAKFGLSTGCAILFHSLGVTLLFCVLVLDICFAYPPLSSGIMSAAALFMLLVISPGNPDAIPLRLHYSSQSICSLIR